MIVTISNVSIIPYDILSNKFVDAALNSLYLLFLSDRLCFHPPRITLRQVLPYYSLYLTQDFVSLFLTLVLVIISILYLDYNYILKPQTEPDQDARPTEVVEDTLLFQ